MTLRDLYFLTSSVSTNRIKFAKYLFTLSHLSSWVSMNSVFLPRQLPRHCSASLQVFLCSKNVDLKASAITSNKRWQSSITRVFTNEAWAVERPISINGTRTTADFPLLALRNMIHPYGIPTYSLCFAIPVTSCECERRAIKLHPLNIYMGEPSYALLLLHYCNTVDLDVVKIPMCA